MMRLFRFPRWAIAAGFALACLAPAAAQQPAGAAPPAASTKETAKGGGRPSPLGLDTNNKEPIKIDADKLDVYDKEGRAVFTGNVIAIQGESTVRCSVMVVFYEQSRGGAGAGAKSAGPAAQDSAIKKIDCAGPVTVVSKTQVATSDSAVFEKAANKVFLIGNASVNDGPNVTHGERIVYDLTTGVANVETQAGGRVKALFVPGSTDGKDKGDQKGAKTDKAEQKADPAAVPKPKRPAATAATN